MSRCRGFLVTPPNPLALQSNDDYFERLPTAELFQPSTTVTTTSLASSACLFELAGRQHFPADDAGKFAAATTTSVRLLLRWYGLRRMRLGETICMASIWGNKAVPP